MPLVPPIHHGSEGTQIAAICISHRTLELELEPFQFRHTIVDVHRESSALLRWLHQAVHSAVLECRHCIRSVMHRTAELLGERLPLKVQVT